MPTAHAPPPEARPGPGHGTVGVLPAVALLAAVTTLAFVGLRALAAYGLVLGDPLLLSALTGAAGAVGFDVGRHPVAGLDRERPRRRRALHPVVRLLVVVVLCALFAWTSGWSLLLPAFATLASVVHVEAAGSRVWRPAVVLQLGATVVGQVGVVLGLVPTVVDPLASHLAAAGIALPCTVTVAYVGRSVTQRELAETGLRRTEARLHALMNASSDVLVVVDPEAHLTSVSPAAARSLGRDPVGLVGTPLLHLVEREQRPEVAARLREIATAPPGTRASLDVLMLLATGGGRWYEWTVASLLDDPLVDGLVVVMRDISERRRHADALARAAARDPLTGLANRTELLRVLDRALPRAAPGAGVGLLFLDLDGFKAINDTHGHAVGDEVLVTVARRLQGSVRPDDLVARLGGDEFCVLVSDVHDEGEIRSVARRVEEAVGEVVSAGGLVLRVGASVGTAVTTDDERGPSDLFAVADAAMYEVKRTRHRATPAAGRGAAGTRPPDRRRLG